MEGRYRREEMEGRLQELQTLHNHLIFVMRLIQEFHDETSERLQRDDEMRTEPKHPSEFRQ